MVTTEMMLCILLFNMKVYLLRKYTRRFKKRTQQAFIF